MRHLPAALVATFLALFSCPLAEADIGVSTVGSSVDFNDPGRAQSYEVSSTASGQVNRLSIYLAATNTADEVELGLYDDIDDHKVASCAITAPASGAWNRCSFAAVDVTAGTGNYWLAVLQPIGSSGDLRFANETGAGRNFWSTSSTLSALPNHRQQGQGWGPQLASLYADLVVPVTECSDGVDNADPEDTLVDLDDPGCTGAADDDETDPTQCSDGVDNADTEDALVDMSDLGCTDAADNDERNQCNDGVDGSDAEDTLVDLDDPGCSSMVDDDETDAPPPGDCTQVVTAATLAAEWQAAGTNAVLCLNAGTYGIFDPSSLNSTAKSGVTMKPTPGVARSSVTIYLDFQPVSGVTVDGVTVTGAELQWAETENVTIKNSRFTGRAIVKTAEFDNANVVFDGNEHLDIGVCGGCYDGRITLPERNENAASGVTIRNSLFEGGIADGIMNGSNGTVIEGNVFRYLVQPASGDDVHVDSIQLYGSKNTVIQDNYFHDNTVAIMAPDGGDHEIIRDNVIVGNGIYVPAVKLGSHVGTQFVHNTVRDIDVLMGSKSGSPASTDGLLQDNVMDNAGFSLIEGNGCTGCTVNNNLTSGIAYLGGADPTTFAGHELDSSSSGNNAATDGTDQGRRFP